METNTIQLTKIEIIEETIQFYSEDTKRRATYDGNCQYNTADGRHCAIGRCLLPKYHEMGERMLGNGASLMSLCRLNDKEYDEMLQEKYRNHSLNFWNRMQNLHDGDHYWDENSLSKTGYEYTLKLKEEYQFG